MFQPYSLIMKKFEFQRSFIELSFESQEIGPLALQGRYQGFRVENEHYMYTPL